MYTLTYRFVICKVYISQSLYFDRHFALKPSRFHPISSILPCLSTLLLFMLLNWSKCKFYPRTFTFTTMSLLVPHVQHVYVRKYELYRLLYLYPSFCPYLFHPFLFVFLSLYFSLFLLLSLSLSLSLILFLSLSLALSFSFSLSHVSNICSDE